MPAHHQHPLRTVAHRPGGGTYSTSYMQSRLQLMMYPPARIRARWWIQANCQAGVQQVTARASAPHWRIGVRHYACSLWPWCNMRWVPKVPLPICTTRLQRYALTWLRIQETTHPRGDNSGTVFTTVHRYMRPSSTGVRRPQISAEQNQLFS